MLQERNATCVLFDKDDTLTSLHSFSISDSTIKKSITALQKMGISMAIVSNSVVGADPEELEGIPIVKTHNKKPFNEAELNDWLVGKSREGVWLVGERLMTDIYLANKLGVKSMLVPPV